MLHTLILPLATVEFLIQRHAVHSVPYAHSHMLILERVFCAYRHLVLAESDCWISRKPSVWHARYPRSFLYVLITRPQRP